MNELKSHIPNLITACNLLCGCIALQIIITQQDYQTASLWVGAALVFDFMDGFVARLLGVQSPLGKELDSLADMVTFGVVPGFVLFTMMTSNSCSPEVCTGMISKPYFPYLGLLVTVFSAFRLAKFNLDTRQSDGFIGLPTPANTIFILSLPLVLSIHPEWNTWLGHPKTLGVIAIVFSYLLVAEIPLIALKFKSWSLKENMFRYLLVVTSILIISILGIVGLPICILSYIGLSIVETIYANTQK